MSSRFREQDRPVETPMTHAPEPGIESVGPALFDLVRKTNRALEVQHQLLRAAIPLMDRRKVVNYTSGITDASGNIDLPLYRVPQGMQFVITRLNIEAVGFSPAVPYTNAAGWLGIIRGDRFAVGSLVDFLPNPPAASGAILPANLTDGVDDAAVIRGGETITLHIATGPATTDIWARIQGVEEPV